MAKINPLLLLVFSFTFVICLIAIGFAFVLRPTASKPTTDTSYIERNNIRDQDLDKILSSIRSYLLDNNKDTTDLFLPDCPKTINLGNSKTNLDLTDKLKKYINSIPKDPKTGTNLDTRYTICKGSKQELEIQALDAEGGQNISKKVYIVKNN